MPNRELHNMRESYESSFLLEEDCNENPFIQFNRWFTDALALNLPEPNAMTLATVGKDGQPSARIVLLKSFSEEGFTFYTNYNSHKGQQIKENAKVALMFWWLDRQVRIEGSVVKIDRASAEQYFHSRPKESQLGALTSSQSQVIANRDVLDNAFSALQDEYKNKEVQMPEYWGGFLVVPNSIEFWQGRISRLHDRIRYSRIDASNWKIERLAP